MILPLISYLTLPSNMYTGLQTMVLFERQGSALHRAVAEPAAFFFHCEDICLAQQSN